MARSRCPNCGATVDIAEVTGGIGTDMVVPLDTHTDAASDADRYRVVKHAPLTVEKVAQGVVGDYYPDHRFECPAHNGGRGAGQR